MRIRFDTAAYRRSHLSQPRGRGQWVFSIEHTDPARESPYRFWAHPGQTLGEAKAQAAGWIRDSLHTGELEPEVGTEIVVHILP